MPLLLWVLNKTDPRNLKILVGVWVRGTCLGLQEEESLKLQYPQAVLNFVLKSTAFFLVLWSVDEEGTLGQGFTLYFYLPDETAHAQQC